MKYKERVRERKMLSQSHKYPKYKTTTTKKTKIKKNNNNNNS